MTDTQDNDIQAALDAGVLLAKPEPIDDGEGRFFSVAVPAGADHEVIDLEQFRDRYRDRPRRKTGTYRVHTTEAFTSYVAKHGLEETEIWADIKQSKVTAVINAHNGTVTQDGDIFDVDNSAGWGDHRATLELLKTPAWIAWTSRDKSMLDQATFAEHIEERQIDIVDPDPATMLEIAQTFQGTRGVTFESGKRLSTGEVNVVWREETDAKAGHQGGIKIPEAFTIALAPYEGVKPYKVIARLRWRVNNGDLTLGYVLDRPEDILRAAFDDITDDIAENTGRAVWHGIPA